ncbi:hypothetical protein PEDI_07810 [Persicobacter diffluens]|uniref:Uncharacterized protein n=1 Tax=Persicobacter diffluens TaxID=981 RepID=A0AAN4VVV3_9BACT|nr:hypothetical protein PEDI_07810 [Persicobacter diffluens]
MKKLDFTMREFVAKKTPIQLLIQSNYNKKLSKTDHCDSKSPRQRALPKSL